MKHTKLWLGMIAMLLCNLLPIHAESVIVRFDDWTSTNHGNGSTSSKTYTFTIVGGAFLSFDWWVSSETNYDKLIVTLDGTTILEKSGSQSGTYNHAITQGEHTLVVKYTKDGSDSSGSDQARISNLTTTTIIDGLAYSTTGNTACVIGAIDTAEVVIPSNVTINDTVYLVTSIGNYAFDNCTALKKIIIEDGNTTLSLGYNGSSQGLFYDCPLEEVYLGRNLSYNSGFSYGYSPFYNKTKLTTLAIGDNVTSIGGYAFEGCSSLTSITIPESVTSIGDKAFYNCSSLYSVTIGSGVLTIGSNAFNTPEKVIWLTNTPPTGYTNAKGSINYVANDLYTSLSNVKVYPYLSSMFEVDGVKYVPVSPSERTCHAIDCAYDSTAESINVSETASFKGIAMTVKEVMPYTFYGNDHIKEVSVSHLGNIGDYAFYDCDEIEIVNVKNQGNIGYQAFYNCSGIKSVEAANNGDIGEQAFYNCHAIETVTVSNQGSIGSQAFYDCDGIKSVDIRNQGSIGSQAFYGCNGMQAATIANYFPAAPSVDDTPLTFVDWTSTNKAHSSTSSETYTFTAGEGATLSFNWSVSSEASYDKLIVTLDGTRILENSGSLSGTYSNTVSKGSHTLVVKYTKDSSNSSGSDQASVSNIVVSKGNNMQTIARVGDEAFSGCTSLKTVTLGDSIGSLGNQAFYQCTSLQEIVIPDFVKTVGEYCFSGCSAMKSATIGDGVNCIAAYTFQGCMALEDVVVGDGVTTISNYAFTDCSALTNIELGNSVATINNYAFRNCSSLPEISIPQATTTIGNYVFSGCSKLADVIIGDRTTALNLGSNGSSALFADCPLDSVYIGGKITYNTTSSKGYSPFYRNTSLRTVVITDREEQVYDNEFYGCTNLQNVTIGNGVKSIGNYAFSGCSSLEGFSFGSSMESIGNEAFSDCTNLSTITSHAAVPPTCGIQALDDINKWNCVLRVPSGYAAAYQAAEQWKEFFFVEDVVEIDAYTLTYVVDGEVYHTEALAHKAPITAIAEPTKEGYTFSGWDEVPATMPAGDVVVSGTFTVNSYTLNFSINGTVEHSYTLAYGDTIVVIDAPVMEGYTFSGWGEVPETMPAHDVTLNGTFTVNKYLVTFTVDGAVIASDSLEYGTAITVPTMPEREGYTFSGWSEVAETVPAYDVTYDASYTANIYKVYYFVGTKLVHTADVAYGEAIPEYVYEPTGEGDVFVGWIGESYDTMPAHDVTYTANITNDVLQLTIHNSQLTIYDLSGRKIEVDDLRELEKGVYVINGRKVVIKNK